MQKVVNKSKYGCLTAALLCSSFLGISGCGDSTEPEDEEIMVIVDQPEEEQIFVNAAASIDDVVKTITVRCIYRHTEEHEISTSMIGKTVEEIYVTEGDQVVKGQLIARLSGGDRQAEIDELTYRIAKNELLLGYLDEAESDDRSYAWWNFHYRTARSEQDRENLEQTLENLQQQYRYRREDYEDTIKLDRQQLEQYRREMEQCLIYADMDGEVFKVSNHLVGFTLIKPTTLVRIFDRTQCVFESSQTQYAEYFKEGEPVELEVNTGIESYIFDVMPLDPDNWDNRLIFQMPPSQSETISAAFTGTIVITTDIRENVLTVPRHAVHKTSDEKYYVYIQGENNIRQIKWVDVGLIGDELAEITGGLTEGELILLK